MLGLQHPDVSWCVSLLFVGWEPQLGCVVFTAGWQASVGAGVVGGAWPLTESNIDKWF